MKQWELLHLTLNNSNSEEGQGVGVFYKLKAASGRFQKKHFFTTKKLKRAPLV